MTDSVSAPSHDPVERPRRPQYRRINYDRLNALLLKLERWLLPQWLPRGRYSSGFYIVKNMSLRGANRWYRVKLLDGWWQGTAYTRAGHPRYQHHGHNLLGLFAHLQGMTRKQAALLLAAQLGIDPYQPGAL